MVRPQFMEPGYAAWRHHAVRTYQLHEETDLPSERLLQAVWQLQRLRRGELTTSDGRRLLVLHPGFWNHEAGPDFRDALLQLGTEPPQVGDIEIDLSPQAWHTHGHARNPAFRRVMLHVVWDGTPRSGLPTLLLHSHLDAPWTELAQWINTDTHALLPEWMRGRCSAPLRDLSPALRLDLFRQAAMVRLEGKARQIQARARETGWEQACWEAVFRALGYKHNVWPMQRLAEVRHLRPPRSADALSLQAWLLGVGGILPQQLHPYPAATRSYLRQLWDHWWREREAAGDIVIPKFAWRLHGLRPANHPARRLALAAAWLSQPGWLARIEQWALRPADAGKPHRALLELLQPAAEPFWSWRWTFSSPRLARPQRLLGAARITDLAMNVILPWLWIRAVEGKNPGLREKLETWYQQWPAGEDNAVLKLARQRLLGTHRPERGQTAAIQQGLLQIVRDFCAHSNAVCERCAFPECVRQWQPNPAP